MRTGQFELLTPLAEQIEEIDRDKMFPEGDSSWDNAKYVIDETREGVIDCLNNLHDKLETVAKAFDLYEGGALSSTAVLYELEQLLKWERK